MEGKSAFLSNKHEGAVRFYLGFKCVH